MCKDFGQFGWQIVGSAVVHFVAVTRLLEESGLATGLRSFIVTKLGCVLYLHSLEDLAHWNPCCRHQSNDKSNRRGYVG
jgi:hypothetical protein